MCMKPPYMFFSGIAQFLNPSKYALCSNAFCKVDPVIMTLYKGVLYRSMRSMSLLYILPKVSM